MGIGQALFLVDPEHPTIKALDVWEPEEKTCEPINPEAAGEAAAGGRVQHCSCGGHPRSCCMLCMRNCMHRCILSLD